MSRADGRSVGYARRQFLRAFGACCGAVAALGSARAFALGEGRTVSFVHTHTGERLVADYYEAGQYQAECLTQVNHLLRDFRTGDIHPIDPSLLDILFALRVLAESQAPFQVISGYRSPATNEMLRRASEGVAQHSMHLEGRAIDVRLEGFATARLGELARSLHRGGVGYYPASDFVHVDTGRVRFW